MTEPRPADLLVELGDAVVALVSRIEDPTAPGLGDWTIGGLSGHLLRAFRTPVRYVAAGPAASVVVRTSAAYFVAYLTQRDTEPGTAEAIALRGIAELSVDEPAEIVAAFETAVADVRRVVADVADSFIVAGPFGGIPLAAYLETRIFEATVHGLDLAAALESTWQPPAAALRLSLRLLVDVAVDTGRAGHLLMTLTGRRSGIGPPLMS